MQELSGHSEGNPWKWRRIAPRGQETLEHCGVFATEYIEPCERVIFSEARDANPYFHFFEALWILSGRRDVEFLAQFNSNMRNFSDDGVNFHAAYGYRLRHHFRDDQVLEAIEILKKDHDTRQVVLQIWDCDTDLISNTLDRPCNDIIFLKIREKKLNMTVCCRSNDMLWGAYGANAVQFSTLLEFMSLACGVGVGTYTQISDSFHVYTEQEAYKRLLKQPHCTNLYGVMSAMRPYPLMQNDDYQTWLKQLNIAMEDPTHVIDNRESYDPFFPEVVLPMWESWVAHKNKQDDVAMEVLDKNCAAYDWSTAAQQWLHRRMNKKVALA